MKYQSWPCIYLTTSTVSLWDVLQHFLSMNLPQKQANSDAIAVITDWSWVSGLFRASCSEPDVTTNEIYDELSLILGQFFHFHTNVWGHNSECRSWSTMSAQRKPKTKARATGSWHFHIQKRYCHTLDITNHIKCFGEGKKVQHQCLALL